MFSSSALSITSSATSWLSQITIAGIIMALIVVNLIKKGKFNEMTEGFEETIDSKIIKKISK